MRRLSFHPWRLPALLAGMICIAAGMLGPGLWGAESAHEDLARSAQLPSGRKSAERIKQADAAVAQGQIAPALALLQSTLDDEAAGFVEHDGVWRHASQVVFERLSRLPSSVLQQYEEQFGLDARQLFDSARGRPEVLGDVVRRYPATRAGYGALRRLTARAFDQGRYATAVRGFERLLAHPRADVQDRPALLSRMILALDFAGDGARARALLKMHRGILDRRPAPAAAASTLGEWLEVRLGSRSLENDAHATGVLPMWGPSEALLADSGPPASQPVWEHSLAEAASADGLLEQSLSQFEREGAAPIAAGVPVVSAGIMVVRRAAGIEGIDVALGKPVWKRQTAATFESTGTGDEQKLLLNAAFLKLTQERLARVHLVDSMHQRVVTDGLRVYGIEHSGPVGDAGAPQDGEETVGSEAGHSSLVGRDLATGEELWRISGAYRVAEFLDPNGHANAETGGVHFLGPPCVDGRTLFVVVQRGRQVELSALDAADGRRRWACPLADTGEPWSADLRRRETAHAPVMAGGLVICPTGAGCLVAVDALTHQPVWGFRYARDFRSSRQSAGLGGISRAPGTAWWEGWRDTFLAAEAGRVFLAPRESDRLYAVDLATGRAVWHRPRRSELYVAGATGDRLLVVDAYAVAALDAATGGELWRRDVGAMSGRGCLTKTHFYAPLIKGGFVCVRMLNGEVTFTRGKPGKSPGNLVATAGGIAFQTGRNVGLLPNLTSLREALSASGDNDSVETLMQLALLEHEAGRSREALAAARRAWDLREEETTRELLREMLLSVLRDGSRDWAELARELRELNDGTLHDSMTEAAARAAAARGNLSAAFEHSLELADARLEATGFFELVEPRGAPRLRVHRDRVLQGEWADWFAQADEQERRHIVDQLNAWLAGQQQSGSPAVVKKLPGWLGWLPERLQMELLAEFRQLALDDLLEHQLRLRRLTQSRDRAVAAAACRELAELLDSHNDHEWAAAHWQRLDREFSEAPLSGGGSVAQWIAKLPKDSSAVRALRGASLDAWPESVPTVHEQERRDPLDAADPVPVIADDTSLAQRLSICVDEEAQQVEFRGAGQQGGWELALPDTGSPYRVAYNLSRAWGVGPLTVLQVGSEVFAIAPLDGNGEPRARLLWQLDTARRPEWSTMQTVRARPGFGPGHLRINDRSGRAIAEVGPVCAAYVCYAEGDQVVVVDTLTGEPLWTLRERFADDRLLGDANCLVRIRPRDQVIECFRALDGKLLWQTAMPFSMEQLVWTHQCRALVEERLENAVRLRCIDLAENKTSWALDCPAGTLPFLADSDRLGTLEPDGSLVLWSLIDGQELARHAGVWSGNPEQIVVVTDPHRFLIGISGPLELPDLRRSDRVRSGYRNPLINGVLLCVDRSTGRLAWSREVDHVAVPLDQHPESPFWWAYARGVPGSGQPGQVSLQLLAKSTGELVHSVPNVSDGARVAVDADPARLQVDVRVGRRALRFQYRSGNE